MTKFTIFHISSSSLTTVIIGTYDIRNFELMIIGNHCDRLAPIEACRESK